MNQLPEPELRPVEPTRRRPQTVGGGVMLLLIASTLVGVALTHFVSPRLGLTWMGAGVVAGALARLLLPDHAAGMLKVRRKSIDVVLMLILGTALVLAASALRTVPAS